MAEVVGEYRGRGATFIGGPAHGKRNDHIGIAGLWPRAICYGGTRASGPGAYAHYVGSNGVYRYAGPCLEFDHDGPNPWEPEPCCCCGQIECAGGPWPT